MMAIPGMSEEDRQRGEDGARAEMERLSAQIKDLILSVPARELQGYIWSTTAAAGMLAADDDRANQHAEINTVQFVLEYVHAVLASFPAGGEGLFKEETVAEIFKIAEELRTATFLFCLFKSIGAEDGRFGERTGVMLKSVLSNWVLMQGNRYGALEEEFYSFALESLQPRC